MNEKDTKNLNEAVYVNWKDKNGREHAVRQLEANEISRRNAWFKYVFFPLLNDKPIKPKMDLGQLAKLSDYARQIKKVIEGHIPLYASDNSAPLTIALEGIPKKGITGLATRDLVNFIASFCQEYSVTIDDSKYSADEQRRAQSSIFYSGFEQFGVLASVKARWNGTEPTLAFPKSDISQNAAQKASNSAPPGTSGHAASAPQQQANTPTAKVPYRPTLADSVGIQGGKVIFPTGTDLVFIKGEWNPPKNTNPRVYTKPRRSYANGSNEPTMYWNTTGQGYEDCILYWDASGLQEARALESALNSSPHKPSNIGSYYLRKVRASGGYFKIKVACPFASSGFVTAYIQASRLQEMLSEEKGV